MNNIVKTVKKINNESGIPKIEFSIILGLNKNKLDAKNAVSFLRKNLLIKKIGTTVSTEKITPTYFCKFMKSR